MAGTLTSSKIYDCFDMKTKCPATPSGLILFIIFTGGLHPIRVKLSGLWVAGQTLFVCACTHGSIIYPGCAAPTGLKQ